MLPGDDAVEMRMEVELLSPKYVRKSDSQIAMEVGCAQTPASGAERCGSGERERNAYS
jgi:hypothetical protein